MGLTRTIENVFLAFLLAPAVVLAQGAPPGGGPPGSSCGRTPFEAGTVWGSAKVDRLGTAPAGGGLISTWAEADFHAINDLPPGDPDNDRDLVYSVSLGHFINFGAGTQIFAGTTNTNALAPWSFPPGSNWTWSRNSGAKNLVLNTYIGMAVLSVSPAGDGAFTTLDYCNLISANGQN